MAKSTTSSRKPTKETPHRSSSQQQKAAVTEKAPPPWARMKNILTCKNLQVGHHQQPQQQKQKHKKPKPMEQNNTKKSKKVNCSGSLCNNTKVMHRPEPTSPEALEKRIASFSNDGSTRSMKTPLREISNNGVMGMVNSLSSTSSSSLLSASSNGYSVSGGGSFRAMPFKRFSGCYECRMVVDPVLGFARDPSLRASICTCPVCGEIFMKPGKFCQVHNSDSAFDKKVLPM